MIAAIRFYLRQVFTRSDRVFLASDFLVAILVGGIVGAYGPRWMHGFPKTGDLANILIAYTAIALGFLVAALAIAITHPSEPLVATLANTKLPDRESRRRVLRFDLRTFLVGIGSLRSKLSSSLLSPSRYGATTHFSLFIPPASV